MTRPNTDQQQTAEWQGSESHKSTSDGTAASSLRQVPEGYVVVPRYPTRDMERAGAEYAQSYGASLNCVAMSVYASMIAAAPKANPAPPTSAPNCDGTCYRSDDGFCDDHHPSRTEPLMPEPTTAQAGAELPERPFRLEVGANGKPTGYFLFDFDESLALLGRARLALKEADCDLHYHDEHGVRRSLVERIDAYLAKGCRNG